MAQLMTRPPLIRGEWLPMTYEEFLSWAPDGMRSEWTDGEGVISMTTTDRHQDLSSLVATVLGDFARVSGHGRVGTASYLMKHRPGGSHREPDVIFVATAHLGRWTPKRLLGPADLVAEILSEDTVSEDRGRKLRECEELGVIEYIMIDARPGRREFAFLRLDEIGRYQPVEPDAEGRYHSTVLPGFWLDPGWFLEEPLPHALTLLRRISPEAWRRLVAEVERDG